MATIHWKAQVNGDFNTAADWSTGAVPGASDDAILDAAGTTAFTVSTSTAETVNSIQLSSLATLDIGARTFTSTSGTGSGANAGVINIENNNFFAVGGTINNTGSITLDSVGNTTEFTFNTNARLTGAGHVTLSDNANNLVLGAAGTTSLTNVNNIIGGSGQFGDGQMVFVNQATGVVDATGTSNALVLNTGAQTVTNAGLLEGTGSAGLTILGTTVKNTGTLLAATGSAVNLQSADIQGGTLATSGSGAIQAVDRGSQLDGTVSAVNNTGVFNVVNNQFLTVIGAIANTGSVNLNSVGNTTELIVGAAGASLSGAGHLTLSDNANNLVLGAAASDVLTNVDNTISGAGQLGNGQMTLANQSKGVIDGTGANNALVINTNGETSTNAGLIEATGAAGLTINSTTIVNTGTLLGATGSALRLQTAHLSGGVLTTVGSGVIQAVDRGSELDGRTATVTNKGVVDVTNNNWLYLEGTIANVKGASLNIDSTGNDTRLIADVAGATLTGLVTMTDVGGNNNTIEGTVSGPSGSQVASTITNKGTIQGAGQIGASSLSLINSGTVDATGANTLFVNVGGGNFSASNTVTNTGLMEATNPGALAGTGGLQLRGVGVSGGTIEANGANTHVDMYSAVITGGATLVTNAGGVIQEINRGSVLEGTKAAVNNTGVIDITNNNWLYIQGTINNTGTINLQATANDTRLRASANAVLTGGGQVVLSDVAGNNNTIDTSAGGSTLENVNNTISGAGFIGGNGLVLTNDAAGVIDATGTGNILILQTGNTVTNLGLIEATGAAGLSIRSSTINDSSGTTILAANGSNVVLLSDDIIGGTIKAAGSGVVYANDRGSNLDGTSAGAVSIAGVLDVTNNNWLYIQGTINNTGTINVQSGGNDTRLRVSANAVLTGGGQVVLTDNINNTFDTSAGGSTLENVNNTISGAGFIGGNGLVLTNDAAGVIDATGTGNILILQTGNTVTNLGLIEATGAAGLSIRSSTINDSSGTTILAANGSNVVLLSDDIIGGTIKAAGSGVVYANDRGSNLDGTSAGAVSIAGVLDVTNNNWLYIQGTINNTGTINVQSGGNDTRLRVSANAVLTGGGQVVLTDNINNTFDTSAGGSTLENVNNTISGSGNIGGNNLVLTNDAAGVIDSTGAAGMTINTGVTVTNAGLIEATGTGGLGIVSTTVNGSAGGKILAANGSTVTLQSAHIIGGTLSSAGTGVVQINDRGTLIDGTTAIVTNAATFNVTNNNWLYIQGTVDNTGSINVLSTGNDTRLRLNANTTLTGNGVIFLNGNSNNTFEGVSGGLSLTNVGNTLEGSGTLFNGNNLIFINKAGGVVDANQAVALVLSTGANTITNAGLLEGTGAGGLTISGVIADSGGTVFAGAGSNVTLTNATLTGGTFTIAATGEIVVGNGSTATIDAISGNAGTILVDSTVTATSLIIDKSTSLTGGGILELSADAANVVKGTKASIVLTNVDNTIEGSGKLGDNKMTLVNQTAGIIDANNKVALTIGTGAVTITNAGLIEATNKGKGTIASAVTNTGTIEANGGTLTLKAALTGSGVVAIASGSLVIANASAAENVSFTGKTGKLVLDQSQTYTGAVSGFSLTGKTSFDLKDVGFVSASEATYSGTASGGVLTVTDGVHTAHITLVGNYLSSTFVASSDGAGGVSIVDPTAPNPTHAMVSAMASLGSSSAGTSASTAASAPATLHPLVAPPARAG